MAAGSQQQRWAAAPGSRLCRQQLTWALRMRSMLALLPYLPVTTTQGVDVRRNDTCSQQGACISRMPPSGTC
jgi:hypothetical protein